MNTNQESFNIELPQNLKRKTSLVKPYKELIIDIRQTGGNWWAEYKVELKPNKDSTWNVLLIDVAEEKYKYLNETFRQGIKRGLTDFVEYQKNRGIELGGIDFQIKNFSYHAVDSKPAAFQYTLIGLLNRLEKTDHFEKEIINTENKSSFFEIKEVHFDRLKEQYLLKETHFQVIVPRIFKQTIKLTKRVEIILNDLNDKKQTFKVILSPKLYDERKGYSIDLELRDEIEKDKVWKFSNQITSLNNQIKEVLETLRTESYNLGGLYILVVPLFDESKEPFLKSNKEYLKWAILNVILDQKYVEIKKETCS